MNYISAVNINQVDNLMLATACKVKLARWKEGLQGVGHLFHIDKISHLRKVLVRLKPEVLLLDHDLPKLDGVRGVFELRKLCPETKIVMLRGSATEDDEWTMFKAGVRGCCADDIEPSSIVTLVEAIQKGELWIRRTLTHRLLEELKEKQRRNPGAAESSLSLLNNLTYREYEIAVLIGNGDSNKEIAHSLDIAERTVKSHLTLIFRKLNVTDRLKVALILTEEKRHERRSPHSAKA
jgi:DNA-binding NarL/FixJ family response regulator